MTSYSTHRLHFGTGYDTPLPEGWVLKEAPEDWATATAPDGKEYLLSKEKAFPILEISRREESPLCGCITADFENGVIDLTERGIQSASSSSSSSS